MGRNKYPEETVALILDVAEDLFGQKGYDDTSIQDIVDRLGGLTKGAIYHHFKSKEAILEAVMNRVEDRIQEEDERTRGGSWPTGAARLAHVVRPQAMGAQARAWHRMIPVPDPIRHARLLGMQFADTFDISAHMYLQKAIEQGVEDGTVRCEHPREAAEALSLLANLWLVPLFGPYEGAEAMRARYACFRQMASSLGIEFDPDLVTAAADEVARVYGGAAPERAEVFAPVDAGSADAPTGVA